MPHPDFNPPGKPPKLTGRKSTITGLFFASLTPYVEPTESEVDEALAVLGMTRDNVQCAYCGDKKSEWDHFRPLVSNRMPTGYITEIANLVPSCGKCNQSKNGKHWKTWMIGSAPKSPKTRQVPDLEQRITRLQTYETWRVPVRIDYAKLAEPGDWDRHLGYLDKVHAALAEAELHAEQLRRIAGLQVRNRQG